MNTKKPTYEKKELRQHIYDNTDTYAGGSDMIEEDKYIFSNGKIIIKKISYIPAIMSLFNEILVNARDQKIRTDMIIKQLKSQGKTVKNIPVKTIKVDFNTETGEISIFNDGDGFEVFKHDTYKDEKGKNIWSVELVTSNLLTSSNYDKNNEESGVVGGKNGYGSKLVNIFSKKFVVETLDNNSKLKYKQEFNDNMTIKNKPRITICKVAKPYTCISWILDFERFGIKNYSEDMISLMVKRVYDIAGCTEGNLLTYINGKNIKINNFNEYSLLYSPKSPMYLRVDPKWDIIVAISDTDQFVQCSFVNGIETSRGGKHVEYIVKQITKNISEYILKKHKKIIPETYIKNYMNIYVNSIINFPSFDSQMKEMLITPAKKFGSKPVVCPKFCKKYADSGIVELVLKFASFKESNKSKASDGKKSLKIRGIPKLDDANDAGGKHSSKCTLILTEGDSAKTMAVSGLSEIGRDRYGVFPMRGKILNVKDAPVLQISDNKEITNLKKILGLQEGMVYKDVNKLRYGRVMVMTDQDHDGSHIKGLLMNVFHSMWPSLLHMGYITSMITPIVKVTKGKKVVSFYNIQDYQNWKSKHKEGQGWNIKYYKGLGTSNTKEAKEYFRDIKDVKYTWSGDACESSMNLAFKKDLADNRKVWLKDFEPETHEYLDVNSKECPVTDFVNRELILFSHEDNLRSIPSVMDGLKPSQRKILYCCFKRKLTQEIRVAQLAGYVSEHGAYHHGETSLQQTITGMAQDYIGTNNINYLKPNGQYGSRIMGGADCASARYINTELNKPIIDKLFIPTDFPLLTYINDDGYSVEPHYYIPLLPTILINGGKGIGTGFSSAIPKYNPVDICNNLKRKLNGLEPVETYPWFKGFTGNIIKKTDKIYITKGIYSKIGEDTICVTELPIGMWTQNFKNLLETLSGYEIEEKKDKKDKKSKGKGKGKSPSKTTIKDKLKKDSIIQYYRDNSDESKVNFTITFKEFLLEDLELKIDSDGINGVEKELKLTSTKSTNLNNMHLYNHKEVIQKYNNINEIIDEFYIVRMALYSKRKDYSLNLLSKQLTKINAKVEFIKGIISDKIIINKQKKKSIIDQLLEYKFPLIYIEKSTEIIINIQKDTDNPIFTPKFIEKLYTSNKYDYLIKLPIDSLTDEKIEELEKLHKNLESEIETINSTSEKEMYLKELDDFLKTYKKFC